MPNQCIHCSEIYEDGAEEVLKGCSKCSGKFFFYLSEEKLRKIKENNEKTKEERELEDLDLEDMGIENLSKKEKEQIEKDVRDIAGITDIEAPLVLDFETVRVTKPGKYILDIPNLFRKDRPLVYKLEDGKYVIDLNSKKKD
jgi:predicted  nucleic acid-binding Zn-ribbon protein